MRIDVQKEQSVFVFPVLSMQYTRYFLIAGVLPLLLVMALGWYVQPLTGDLTRLGRLPERDFGWNSPQFSERVMLRDPQAKPTVAVLGDSFSERNIWQSIAMAQLGVSFVSFDWAGVGSANCIAQWIAAVHKAYPSVRVVLVETVERMFVERFAAPAVDCQNLRQLAEIAYEAGKTPVGRLTGWQLTLPDIAYAWKAALSTGHSFEHAARRGSVYIAPLIRRDLFSSKRSDLLLLDEDDLQKWNWQSTDLQFGTQRIHGLQLAARVSGLKFVIIVVPDKSTAYAAYLRRPLFDKPPLDVWKALADRNIEQIDIRQALSSAMPGKIDLYLPNDTHFGIAGYRILGDEVAIAFSTY